MILKKPYAFLIKYFRLIHLVLTGLLIYIVSKFNDIYKFFQMVIDDPANRYDAFSYVNNKLFIYILIVLVLCYIIYRLLKYKDKPRKMYIFTIVGYIVISIFMMVLFNYMNKITMEIDSEKVIRLYRDILLITLFIQYYNVIIMGIRGLGFDIKKFDFGRDIQELNLNESDSEEIEVNLNINTTNVMREIRRQKREFGYFYKEFKGYIIVIIILIIGILCYKGYSYYNDNYKIYNENDIVGIRNRISIKDSYYKIDSSSYVIVNFDIFNNGRKEQFNTGNMVLVIGNEKYTINKNICYRFNKLGNCYKNQYITNKLNNYIVVFEVDNLNIQEAYILYDDGYDESYKIKLIMKEFKE